MLPRESRFGSQGHIWGLVLSLILLVAVAAASFAEFREYVQVADKTRNLNSFLNVVREFVGACLEAQANERSYLLVRSARYHEAYERAVSRLQTLQTLPVMSSQDAEYRQLFSQLRREVDTQVEGMNVEISKCHASDGNAPCGSDKSVRLAVLTGDRVYAYRDAVLHRGTVDLGLSRDRTRLHAELCAVIATVGCSGIFVVLFLSAEKIKTLLREQWELNHRLSRYADELRNIADSVPQVLWRMKEDGTVEYANHHWADVLGPAMDDDGQMWMMLLHPDDQSRVSGLFRERDRPFIATECRLRNAEENTYRWFLLRALASRDGSPSEWRWYGTFTDIDDQKQAEAALTRMNEELRQFAYIAAHDLQEPLRNVANLSGLVLKSFGDELAPDAVVWLKESSSNSRRMITMVKDLLAFSTALENASLIKATADSEECLTAAVINLEPLVRETAAEIVRKPLPPVRIGASQLIQLFQNLIGNALKYRRAGIHPVINVEARRDGQEYVFSVSDNGIGFDPAYAERIFRIFKRLHSQDEYAGNGIGLAVCARIVGYFGGRIWAEGQPGKGAAFYFTLLAAADNRDRHTRASVASN